MFGKGLSNVSNSFVYLCKKIGLNNLGSFITTRIYSVEPLFVIMVQEGRLNRGSFSLWPSTVELNDWKALFMTSFLIICKKYILYSSERVVNLKWSRTSSLPIQGKHICPKFQQKYKWICAPIEDSDQPVYPRRLIRAFCWALCRQPSV